VSNTDVVWSPDGRLLNSTTGAPEVGLWDATTGREVARTSLAPEAAMIAAFSPDGRSLLVGTNTGMVHVLAVPSLERVREPIQVGVGAVGGLAVSPKGHDAVAQGERSRMFDYGTGELGAAIGTTDDALSVGEFSPDGGRIFTFADGRVRLLDVETMTWVSGPVTPEVYEGGGMAWSRDGAFIATSGQGRVAVWDGHTGAIIGAVGAPSGDVGFTDDGTVVVAGADGTVRTWDPRPSAWVAAACQMAGRDLTEAEWRDYLPDREYSPVCS
jgi:WD40 repeat protein